MYSLIGFIHVLLMLTQSRFTPDLGSVWKEEASAGTTLSSSFSTHTLQLPVERNARFSFAMIRPEDKERIKLVLQTEARTFIHIQKIKRSNKALSNKKLYLLLGQLKTEG